MIMRKIFTFLFVALLTTNLWATQTVVPAGTSTPEDQVKAAIDAASAGDTIVLETANYVEWQSITVDKKITIMAAEGAKPMIKVAKFKVKAPFEINGVECYSHNSDYMFYTEANIDGVVALKNCTLRDDIHNMYYIVSGYAVNQLVIDNCLIKNFTKDKNAVIYGDGTITSFEMRNSTVMNCTGAYPIRVKNASSIIVNHCTFYNNGERVMLLGDNTAPATCAVSNCVVSNPSVVTNYCFSTYAGTVDNCVYYNTASGAHSGPTITNLTKADPQFVDPDNGNFNFAFTSPLFLAATDGSNIGDPRWNVEAGDNAIAVPDTLPAMQAVLSGTKISATEDGVKWNSISGAGNYASWTIEVEKAGDYDIVINQSVSGMGHRFIVSIANETAWLDTIEESVNSWASNDINIGTLHFAEAGIYQIRLDNAMSGSSAVAKYFIVKYLGGAMVDVPASLPIEDAIINGPRVSKAESGLKWNNSSDDASSYVTWNVNVTKAGDYEVVVNENTEFGHNYSVTIENDQETLPDVGEGKDVWKSGDISLGIISIANTGVYTIKLTNTTLNSTSLTNSLSLNYIGGGIVNVPGILLAEDALLGGKVIRLENGSVKWPNQKDVDNHYVTWNINATAAGDVDVIAHIGESSSGHCFTASLYEGETLKSSVAESATVYTTGEVKLGTLNIPAAGAYTLRLTNAVEWSSAIVDALELKEAQVIETIEIGDDQTDVDFTAYAGKTVNIKLNRTIKADMFTPFCLPFALHSDALNSVLKSDKAYVLDDAQIQDQTLSVKLQTYSSIYQGTPFLIKPTEEVVDPIFENVTIMNDPQASSTTKGNVTFQGSFAKENLTESDKVLLVGNNNTLFYPNDATTPYIKSMRAYFRVNVEANKLPRFAAFIEPGNAPTEMIIVGGEAERQKGHRKVLVDGQIRIQHEGKCYSILGLER